MKRILMHAMEIAWCGFLSFETVNLVLGRIWPKMMKKSLWIVFLIILWSDQPNLWTIRSKQILHKINGNLCFFQRDHSNQYTTLHYTCVVCSQCQLKQSNSHIVKFVVCSNSNCMKDTINLEIKCGQITILFSVCFVLIMVIITKRK